MRRSIVAVAACAGTLFPASAPAFAAEPVMAFADVRAGMVCTASSVVSGIEPVAFGAEVIGVLGTTPQNGQIVMRFSGAAIAEGGIGQGFSGSPVRCPDAAGQPRVVGAIAYGLGQYDNTIAAVTPIEAMLAMPTMAEAPRIPAIGSPSGKSGAKQKQKQSEKKSNKKTASKTVRGLVAARGAAVVRNQPPLLVSGIRGPLAGRFAAAAARGGRMLAVAPVGRRSAAIAAQGLKPGDAVAATSVYGDVDASAIGTVTYVDGHRVWAFGHPNAGTGAARLRMERAQITTLVNSPAIGDQVSFKLGAPIGAVGTLGFDGAYGVGGELGATPPAIPVRATVKNTAGDVLKTSHASVVDERAVRGGTSQSLLGLAAGAVAGNAVQLATNQSAVAGSARTCTTIFLRGEKVPLYQCRDTIVPADQSQGGGVETGAADSAITSLSPALSAERFARLVDRVSIEVTLRDQADTVHVRRVRLVGTARAGRKSRLRVTVMQGSTGEEREITVQVHIPRAAAGQHAGIVVFAQSDELDEDSILDLFADEEEVAAPRSLPRLRALYTDAGISGLRAAVIPGVRGAQAREVLVDGGDESLSRAERDELTRHVKLVSELPNVVGTGTASLTTRVARRR